MISGASRLWECFCICERELLSTREKCHATCCYAEEDLPNLAVFVHAIEVERREACRANNSSSFVARSLIIVTPWWQSDSKHDGIRISIYSCGSWISPYKSELKKSWMFLHKTKRSFPLQVQADLFQHLSGQAFQYIHNMSKCSILRSLSLSHAVLARKTKIWLLIHHSCLALLLITFLAVWGEAKNLTCHHLAGSTVLVGFVNNQQWAVHDKNNYRQWTT